MKSFTINGTSTSRDIVHLSGNIAVYDVTENNGTLTYTSKDGSRQYTMSTSIEALRFQRPDTEGKTKFTWDSQFAPYAAKPSCKAWLDSGATSSGIYKLTDGVNQYDAYCDMITNGGGWTHIGTISDNGESVNNAAHIWSNFNATQDTNIWEDNTTVGSQSFTADFKSKAWSTVAMTQMLIKDSGDSLRNLLMTTTGQFTANSTSEFFGAMSWGTNGSESSSSAYTNGRVTAYNVANFGIVDPVLEAGNKTVLLFKFGERDGVQDNNKDRSMIAWHRHNYADNVDAPAGLGNFTNRSGTIDVRDIMPYGQKADYPVNISGAPYNYTLWVR